MATKTSENVQVIERELVLLVVSDNSDIRKTLARMSEPLGEITVITLTPKEEPQCLMQVVGDREQIERFFSLIKADGLEILDMERSGHVSITFPYS